MRSFGREIVKQTDGKETPKSFPMRIQEQKEGRIFRVLLYARTSLALSSTVTSSIAIMKSRSFKN